MASFVRGVLEWSVERDDDGHRTYTLKTLVISDDTDDGPAVALTTPGVPLVGTLWLLGNDFDPWAWCRPGAKVTPLVTKEPNRHFVVEQKFSTKALTRTGFGDDGMTGSGTGGGGGPSGGGGIEDPLLEPPHISGSFIKYTEEATYDRFGNIIENSAHEPIRGPLVEFDASRPKVRISQNVPFLEADVFVPMVDTVNDAPLWGMPERCWKLSDVQWERKMHGVIGLYYTRIFEFEGFVKYDPDTGEPYSGFDRFPPDEGTKVLNGKWANDGTWQLVPVGYFLNESNPIMPDPENAADFMQFVDKAGNQGRVRLNGAGMPALTPAQEAIREVEYYSESNFLLLGVPITF